MDLARLAGSFAAVGTGGGGTDGTFGGGFAPYAIVEFVDGIWR